MTTVKKVLRWIFMGEEHKPMEDMKGRAAWLAYGGSLRRAK